MSNNGLAAATQIDLPIWTPMGRLVHIGTMDPQDKGAQGDSLEGHGLSVSECPDDWEYIARLGGNPRWDVHPLPRQALRFLHLHQVSSETMDAMRSWAVEAGLAAPAKGYKVSWFDGDHEDFVYMTFTDESQAKSEFEFYAGDFDAESQPEAQRPKFEAFDGFAMTPEGLALLRRKRADLTETDELCALLYVEDQTDLIGAYWADRHAPEELSAPRAVILPTRLDQVRILPEGSHEAESIVDAVYSTDTERIRAALARNPEARELNECSDESGETPLFHLVNTAMVIGRSGLDEAGTQVRQIAASAVLVLDAGGKCEATYIQHGALQVLLDQPWHQFPGSDALEVLAGKLIEKSNVDVNARLARSLSPASELYPLAASIAIGNHIVARRLLAAGADPSLAAVGTGFEDLIEFANSRGTEGASRIGAMLAERAMNAALSAKGNEPRDPSIPLKRRAAL
ncbi:hypothetical protein ABIC83_002541 [Roseateles asaccharophilus]|uniref:hypothetical protein n=1 Tax=Roseateles asaccharophilus TaxID=582607 RepID=UPI003835840B